jgi:hypothetical protein
VKKWQNFVEIRSNVLEEELLSWMGTVRNNKKLVTGDLLKVSFFTNGSWA